MRYVFYDTEGTGTNTRFDRVLQYAAIVTNESFEEIETIDIRGQLPSYVTPHPMALYVTHTDPYDIMNAPLSSFEFARAVHKFMSRNRPAKFVGQNILNYDEEIIRTMFWMNLLDPYLTSGRSQREDTLHILRFIHTQDPTAFEVPINPKTGNVMFKLDQIAPLNGFADHNAHDALGDVRATIYMYRLMKERRPQLFEAALAHCSPASMEHLLTSQRSVNMLSYFGKPRWHQITRIGQNPKNSKQVACFDLAYDPTPWLNLSPADMLVRMFQKSTGAEGEVIDRGLKTLSLNKQPMLVPLSFPGVVVEDAVPVDVQVRRLELIHSVSDFGVRVGEALALRMQSFDQDPVTGEKKVQQIEDKIYGGDFPNFQDKDRMKAFQDAGSWEERAQIVGTFQKKELRQIGMILVLENAPDNLSPTTRVSYERALIQNRILTEATVPWTSLPAAIQALAEVPEGEDRDQMTTWYQERDAACRARLAALG